MRSTYTVFTHAAQSSNKLTNRQTSSGYYLQATDNRHTYKSSRSNQSNLLLDLGIFSQDATPTWLSTHSTGLDLTELNCTNRPHLTWKMITYIQVLWCLFVACLFALLYFHSISPLAVLHPPSVRVSARPPARLPAFSSCTSASTAASVYLSHVSLHLARHTRTLHTPSWVQFIDVVVSQITTVNYGSGRVKN